MSKPVDIISVVSEFTRKAKKAGWKENDIKKLTQNPGHNAEDHLELLKIVSKYAFKELSVKPRIETNMVFMTTTGFKARIMDSKARAGNGKEGYLIVALINLGDHEIVEWYKESEMLDQVDYFELKADSSDHNLIIPKAIKE